MADKDSRIYELNAQLCKIFTSPKRLEIIDILQKGEQSVNDLATRTGISQSNVSQHLSLLREKGVVATRREGTTIYYHISNPRIVEACKLMRMVLLEMLEYNSEIAATLSQ